MLESYQASPLLSLKSVLSFINAEMLLKQWDLAGIDWIDLHAPVVAKLQTEISEAADKLLLEGLKTQVMMLF